ncbi:MAG: protein translocase subunit SecD [Bacillota bacterium]|nr:protein translocase subunit SecD [Bacillota bacterium]
MKGKNIALFFLIVALIAGAYFVSLTGIRIGNFEIAPVKDQMKLGLDIKGGVVVVYEAVTEETGAELDATMHQTIRILSRRINELGLTEPTITRQGDNRIRIELPGVESAAEAIAVIGRTAKLEFRLVLPQAPAFTGMKVEDFASELVLSGNQVAASGVDRDQYGGYSVSLKFNDDGAKAFFEATKRAQARDNALGQIAIVLDGEVISAPRVDEVISTGSAIITGNFTYEDASNLALLIRGGALPVQLNEAYTSEIGPTLGLNSLNSAVKAAIVGLILVGLYMILYYRYPGLIASIALSLYALLIVYAMIGFNATLTLPGIAGIVISLGMAVDANVIIFERVKEELRNGKSIRASIHAGFKRAMSTVMDSNITTLIAAIVLFFFGDGPIKGFAVTLMIGIVASMFTAIVLTRTLLNLGLAFTNNPKLYGYKEA